MTSKTQYQFSVRLPDWCEWPHDTPQGTYVMLYSTVSQEKIVEQMATLQLKALVWQSRMRRKEATKKIAQDMAEYAMALQEKNDCPLIRWVFGDSSALTIPVWQVPLSMWHGAILALVQSACAYTKRSDWHESHCKAFWKEIAATSSLCVWGWPAQDMRRFTEGGEEELDWLDGDGPGGVPF